MAPEPDRYRTTLVRMLEDIVRPPERILAVLPFVTTRKRPKQPGAPRGKAGKVRVGVYQSWRRYRPLVVTDRRLFVFETGRTPNPREVLAVFALADIELVSSAPSGFGATGFVLELPGVGQVPFEAGRREQGDLEVLVELLGGAPAT
jgi:hypothetical protein